MPIISISLKEKLAKELEEFKKNFDSKSRSDLVGSAIKSMIQDKKQRNTRTGRINGVLIVVHGEKNEIEVSRQKHNYDDIIKTHVHTNMEKGCMDLFVLDGDAAEVNELQASIEKIKNIGHVKLIVA